MTAVAKTTITCPQCGRTIGLRQNGLISRHSPVEGKNRRPGFDFLHPCAASGTSPVEWETRAAKERAKDLSVHLLGAGWQAGRSRCGALRVKSAPPWRFTSTRGFVTCRKCLRILKIRHREAERGEMTLTKARQPDTSKEAKMGENDEKKWVLEQLDRVDNGWPKDARTQASLEGLRAAVVVIEEEAPAPAAANETERVVHEGMEQDDDERAWRADFISLNPREADDITRIWERRLCKLGGAMPSTCDYETWVDYAAEIRRRARAVLKKGASDGQ